MNIHEYQAKEILRGFGVPVAFGVPIFSADDIDSALKELSEGVVVVKSQIHAGGRGKGRFVGLGDDSGGGVRVARSADEVRSHVSEMLGSTLVTKQTGALGKQVNCLYLEEGADISRELYCSLLVNRETGRVSFVASTEGGMDIEAVAAETPEKIHTIDIDSDVGVDSSVIERLVSAYELEGKAADEASALFGGLYEAFVSSDMSLLEVNPLVVLGDGGLRVLDSKVSFDNNAQFRHPEWDDLRDLSEEDEKEIEASRHDLSYVALDGNIGCMVNGAGLAMATMDIIKLYGGEPANFLDVGGGATVEKVTAAFKIITADPNVSGILVNIFGGIMRCDVIAEGVVTAIKDVGLKVPLVVRLEGTKVDEGKRILSDSGLDVEAADDLDDAARRIVSAIEKVGK